MIPSQPFRLRTGGLVDRNRPLAFTFDGKPCTGFAGDTLASALLANGVRLVGRSFKYHRPRGIMTAGAEEPNALLQVGTGSRTEPNLRATQVELHEGLVARTQNCWPSVTYDLGAVNTLVSRFLPAGFYYKTFMWPASAWMTYERWIRRAAGLGRAPSAPDPDRYEHRHVHCDVLVVGSGPAGLAAAQVAARSGARVILAEQDFVFGGSLLGDTTAIDGEPGPEWARRVVAELRSSVDVTLLPRTTVFGYFDHNALAMVELLPEGRPVGSPRQRLWKVRARQVVLATGAIERALVFADNDRPGIMLAGAARIYVNRFGVRPGIRSVVVTNNDSAYAAAVDCVRAGMRIECIVDLRSDPGHVCAAIARDAGIELRTGQAVISAHGGRQLAAVRIGPIDGSGRTAGTSQLVDCDNLLVSGGWNPVVHLYSQSHGRLRYDAAASAFLPDVPAQAVACAGSANGTMTLRETLAQGYRVAADSLRRLGRVPASMPVLPRTDAASFAPPLPVWAVESVRHRHVKRFVDFQNDVTAADIALAAREGYVSVEHLKRYTTLGMGTDQGKLGNVPGLALLAAATGSSIPEVGTTTFRPPYTPVTLGAIAGPERGPHFAPTRYTPMHDRHVAANAVFVNAGLWVRPQFYRQPGESDLDAVNREALNVRSAVGLVDVSTLGKIDIQGPGAVELLERVYINRWRSLRVGMCRYGVMCREDGMVYDDGTVTRLGDQHYLMTTSTVNAGRVMAALERSVQVDWPDLDVYLASVTDQWAAAALAGPRSLDVLAAVADADVGGQSLPYLGYRECRIAGIPARVFRISFSGERAYEINVPAGYGAALWDALLEAGAPHGIMGYGTESMGVLRIEKGHFVVGPEADGRTTPDDLGLARLVKPQGDFIGRRSLLRPALAATGRKQLVGLLATDRDQPIPRGAMLVTGRPDAVPPIAGHVTSMCYSPTLGRHIALGLLADGRRLHGERFQARSPLAGRSTEVTVVDPVFVDPAGERVRD
jgi:sarcosine oxidase subunit alpha